MLNGQIIHVALSKGGIISTNISNLPHDYKSQCTKAANFSHILNNSLLLHIRIIIIISMVFSILYRRSNQASKKYNTTALENLYFLNRTIVPVLLCY